MFECTNVRICTNIFHCCLCLDDCAEQLHTFIHECTRAVLYAFMRAGKTTCINRSAKGAQTYTGTCTHVHTCCLTFHLRFVLGQTPLLPPQLSMWSHHLWPLDSRLSLRPSFLNSDSYRSLAVSPPETFRPQCPLQLCSPWPFTPVPLAFAALQMRAAHPHQCRSAALDWGVSLAEVSVESPGLLIWKLIHRWAGLKKEGK